MEHKKKIQLLFSLALASLLTLPIGCSTSSDSPATPTVPTNTTGLTVSVVSGTTGGNYSPRNVAAIWIENSTGTFIKTLTVYAQTRKSDLTNWATSSAGSTVDAVTGATQSNFGTIYGRWNGTDKNGNAVPDGTYRVCMELTDKASTGNFSSFTFTKGTGAETQTPANVPSFSSISIKWVPL